MQAVVGLIQRMARRHTDEEEDICTLLPQTIAGSTIPLKELREGVVVIFDIRREAQPSGFPRGLLLLEPSAQEAPPATIVVRARKVMRQVDSAEGLRALFET